MASPHDAPDARQLVEAVREWLEGDVVPTTDGRLRFHARVAINMLGMVEREIELGPAQAEAHRTRVARFGAADDAELAAAIRRGDLDDRFDELRDMLRAMTDDKLAVANPRYVDPR